MADSALSKPPDIYRERYTISSNHDHVLVVLLTTQLINGVYVDTKDSPPAAYEFEVSRKVLRQIPYFARTLPDEVVVALETTSELRGDDARAWKLWLEILHGRLHYLSYEVQTTTVWHVLDIAERYGISVKREDARDWFNEWFNTQSGKTLFTTVDSVREVLFPCHAFDNAQAFSTSTMWLAYHCAGHIEEKRPWGFEYHPRLGLDHGIEQQLNAARGRLKSVLHRALYDTVDILLEYAECELKKDVLWEYFTSLNKTKSWPLERYAKRFSINRLLENLEAFEYADPHPTGTCNDDSCGQDFKWVVEQAISRTETHFDGLCLDCMKVSRAMDDPKRLNNYHDTDNDWSEGCRVKHGESTFYHSDLGRKDKRSTFA